MSPLTLKIIGWIASVAAVAGLLYGAYHYGRHVQELTDNAVRDAAVIAQQQTDNIALTNYAGIVSAAESQHDIDQKTIDDLHSKLTDPSRVRIHFPSCPAVQSTAETTASTDGSARMVPESVDSLFADLQGRISEIIQRCDQLNIDTIRQNAEVAK